MTPTASLSDVATITMGQSPPGASYNVTGNGWPLLNGPTEFGTHHPASTTFSTKGNRFSEPDDLLFCVRGSTTGRMNWSDQRYVLGRGIAAIRAGSRLETKFIFYAITNGLPLLLQRAGGSTFPNLTKRDFETFEIPWPTERRRIADVLSAFDDLIQVNARRIAILEEMARRLFDEWFVALRFPGAVGSKACAAFGAIPENSHVVTLDTLMNFEGGSQPPKREWSNSLRDGFVRMIQIRDYQSNKYVAYVRDTKKLRKCTREDIMIARYGASVARICWGLDGAYNVALVKVIPRPLYFREFLRSFLNSPRFQDLLIGMSGRTAQAGFNKSVLKSISLVLPSDMAVIEEFETIAIAFTKNILALRQQSICLLAARDLLLPKLIFGEINIGLAQRGVTTARVAAE